MNFMNYMMINGEKIEFTKEQVKKIKESVCGHAVNEDLSGDTERKRLSDVDAEDTFNAGKFKFIKLEQVGDDVLCLLKDTYVDDVEFGDNNNFDGSNHDEICKKFEAELAEAVGAENIVEHTVDLTSDDGLKCYGTVRRKVSGFTAELARRYVHILDKYKLNKYWWLVTPHSTPKHENANWVKCVSPSGIISSNFCNDIIGVRPFCILKSNIFVS